MHYNVRFSFSRLRQAHVFCFPHAAPLCSSGAKPASLTPGATTLRAQLHIPSGAAMAMLGHGDLGNLRNLSPVAMERRRLWDEFGVPLGCDGSVIGEGQICFVVTSNAPVRSIKVDYPHGWAALYGSTMIQTDPDKEDLPTDCLIASDHGYVANRLIHLVRHCRAFLRARRLRTRHH